MGEEVLDYGPSAPAFRVNSSHPPDWVQQKEGPWNLPTARGARVLSVPWAPQDPGGKSGEGEVSVLKLSRLPPNKLTSSQLGSCTQQSL